MRGDIVVDMPRLAPTLVAVVQHAQRGLDVLFERYSVETVDCQPLQFGQVAAFVRTD